MTKEQAYNDYNAQYAAIQDELSKAQADYDKWLSGVDSSKSYNKSTKYVNKAGKVRYTPQSSTGGWKKYTSYNAADNGAYVLDNNGNYVKNQTNYYQNLINSITKKFDSVTMSDYDKAANYSSADRQGAINLQDKSNGNLDAQTTQASQALNSQQQSDAATAQANKTANISAGINKSSAGLLGSQAASTDTSVAQGAYTANRNNYATTQADYLKKMAQAEQLDVDAQAARNMTENAGMAAIFSGISGALTGAGSGAQLGAAISDENMKESPKDDILEMVKQFRQMYKKLQQLKGVKK